MGKYIIRYNDDKGKKKKVRIAAKTARLAAAYFGTRHLDYDMISIKGSDNDPKEADIYVPERFKLWVY